MALVFCRSCKAKITQRDTTCPRCGSPTSRLVPIVTGIVLSFAAVVIFAAVRVSLSEVDRSVAGVTSPPDKHSSEGVQTVLSDD